MNDKAAELAQRLIRNFNTAERKHFVRGQRYESHGSRLSQGTAARRLAMSVDTVPPGKLTCPYHFHHAEEEIFIVIEGTGTLRVAGELLPLTAGDVVFIPTGPEYPHHILNTSDAPLKYLSIGTNEPLEICEYPDSGKYLATAGSGQAGTGPAFDIIHRKDHGVDYWEGEE
jgi:uncharacterized cupin superfamily protein